MLTEADLVHVDPWILPIDGNLPTQVRVQPGPATSALLAEKCRHGYDVLLAPFVEHLHLTAHSDGGPAVDDGPLVADPFAVHLRRPVSAAEATALAAAYPQLAAAIDRLTTSALPRACSSLLRFNLTAVMAGVLERLDAVAIGPF